MCLGKAASDSRSVGIVLQLDSSIGTVNDGKGTQGQAIFSDFRLEDAHTNRGTNHQLEKLKIFSSCKTLYPVRGSVRGTDKKAGGCRQRTGGRTRRLTGRCWGLIEMKMGLLREGWTSLGSFLGFVLGLGEKKVREFTSFSLI